MVPEAKWEQFADLEHLAAKRGISLVDLEAAVSRLPVRPQTSLSTSDIDALQSIGVAPSGGSPVPQLAGILQRNSLENQSLTVEQVAALLGRDRSRIRQRLSGPNRNLLGFHSESAQRQWLLPRIQFELGLHAMPAWGTLLQALPPADDTSPTALLAWLVKPRPHLGDRGRAQALADGYAVDVLVAEATTFGVPG